MRRLPALLAALTCVLQIETASPLHGQIAAATRGRVLAGDTGRPLRGAEVALTAPRAGTGTQARTTTDDQGRFEFTGLKAGEYTIHANKAGYVAWSYGQRRPSVNPPAFALAGSETRNGLEIVMPRAGAVVVHVTDDFGGAIGRLNVQLQRSAFSNGERLLTSAAFAYTDDAGDARVSGVPPGEYVLAVAADSSGRGITMLNRSDSGLRYARTTYYPGTAALAEARRVVVSGAQDTLVTIPLATVRTAHLAGIVRSSDGAPVAGFSSAMLLSAGNSADRESMAVQPDGRFDWPNMIPGQYIVTPGAGRRVSEFLRQPLTVDGDNSNLVITTTKGSTINGRLAADAGALPPGFDPSVLGLAFVGGLSAPGRPAWNDDAMFTLTEQAGSGVFRLGTGATRAGWFLQSVTRRGVGITDIPTDAARLTNADDVRLVLTRARTEVAGTAIDGRGTSVKDFAVVVFPDDRALRSGRTRHVMTAQDDAQGRFTLSGLPPGQYAIVAVDGIDPGEELDADFLASLEARASALTLTENERKAVTLRLVPR